MTLTCAACYRRREYDIEQADEKDDEQRRTDAISRHIREAVTTIDGTALCEMHSLEYPSGEFFKLAGQWWAQENPDLQ